MTISYRRPLAALALLAVCTSVLPQTALQADTRVATTSARSLDLTADETRPLADGLHKDLGPLLASAQYRRHKDDPAAPKHSLTSVPRIVEALSAHEGVAYVVLAERVDGGDAVQMRALHVLEGAPIGGGTVTVPGSSEAPSKAAVDLDLTSKSAQPLVTSLHAHLGALLPPAGAGDASAVEDVVAALEGQRQLAFVVLAQRAGAVMVDRSRVFVVPDVLRISITDDAAAASMTPSGDAPEVELVPSEDGGPPMIKFEFDPEKYDITKKKRGGE